MENKEMIIEFYKLNNDYHDKKENMAWLAASIFIGYFALFIGLILQYPSIIKDNKTGIIIMLSSILVLAISFVITQTWYKSRSVFIYFPLPGLKPSPLGEML